MEVILGKGLPMEVIGYENCYIRIKQFHIYDFFFKVECLNGSF